MLRIRYLQNFQPKLGPDVVVENAVAVPRVGELVKIHDKLLVVHIVTWHASAEATTQDVDVFVGYR